MRQRLILGFLALLITFGQGRSQQPLLDHVAIQVKDVEASAAFYKKAFGMAELPNPFKGAPIPVKWMDLGHGIALHIVGGRTEPVVRPNWEHIALSCGNMDATIARLNAAGIAWANTEGGKSAQARPDGVKQIFVQDPDGYWVEINDRSR